MTDVTWLEAGDSARMMLPCVSLHVFSGPFSLSMWNLHVISPTGNQNYWRAVQSTQEHKNQAFFMRKPRTGTRPSLPHKFQAQHSFKRGDDTSCSITSKCNRISYSLWSKLHIIPTPLHPYNSLLIWALCLKCFPSTSPSIGIFLIFLGSAQSYFCDYILDISSSHTGNNHSFISTPSTQYSHTLRLYFIFSA